MNRGPGERLLGGDFEEVTLEGGPLRGYSGESGFWREPLERDSGEGIYCSGGGWASASVSSELGRRGSGSGLVVFLCWSGGGGGGVVVSVTNALHSGTAVSTSFSGIISPFPGIPDVCLGSPPLNRSPRSLRSVRLDNPRLGTPVP